MPTENRSSNTEMVSVPREWLNSVALLQMPLDELQEQAIEHLCEPCDEPAQQHLAEPVGYVRASNLRNLRLVAYCAAIEMTGVPRQDGDIPLYTHADPAEVERLRAVIEQQKNLIESLRAELVESHSIDANAEPSAPAEIDERAELEAYCTKVGLPLDRLPSGEYLIPATRFISQGWHAHARAALERKP